MGCTGSKAATDVSSPSDTANIPTKPFEQPKKKLYLLHIVVSPMGDNSYSRKLSAAFLEEFTKDQPLVKVVTRDLNEKQLDHIDGEGLMAGYMSEESRSADMKRKHQLRLDLIKEITEAMAIVISTPMYNWSTPSVLKAYIDQIIMPGVLDPHAKGLTGKSVTMLVACGGSYKPDSHHPEFDYLTNYLELVAKNLGSTNVLSIRTEYTLAGSMPGMESLVDAKEASFAEATAAAKERAKTLFQDKLEKKELEVAAAAVAAGAATTLAVEEEPVSAEDPVVAGAADPSAAAAVQEEEPTPETSEEPKKEEKAAVVDEPVPAEVTPEVIVPAVVKESAPPPAAAAAAAAAPTGPPMKKGYILKQGHVIKNWKNRYFVLDEGVMVYYENPSPNPPYGVNKKGEMSLKGVSISVDNQHVQLKGSASDTELLLEIRYPTEREEWIEAMKQHIAYYFP